MSKLIYFYCTFFTTGAQVERRDKSEPPSFQTVTFFLYLISGYDVIKSVWLKFNSYNFTHCEFTKEDMRGLLDFLNTIETHTRIVAEIDEKVRSILHKEKELLVP